MIISIISAIFIGTGIIFFAGAAIGIIRFPDFYTRTHAAGKGDTLSSLLVITGFAIYQLNGFESFSENWPILLVILKLLGVSIFILFTSPTATHALMDAGWEECSKPKIKEGRPNHLGEDSDQF
ncbi:MAG: sodium:proton antiporter [Verrucomicrobiales bacterium]|jgi:multicomponent Na+:H+ antiporter subunit G|nr:sodium:proton antiporter [Verrucomicrobiales bacterium]|tara:strand:+ start:23976 stop:24347 length:372 start_codon:yes stop_codon:yes gene_type:complete